MSPTQFTFEGHLVLATPERAEVFRGDDHLATVTFRPSGVYTVTERGRGDAQRLPEELRGNPRAATAYALYRFWPHLLRRAA